MGAIRSQHEHSRAAQHDPAEMESGIIAATVPIVFPTIILESGNTTIIRIIKGIDLNIFIMPSKILYRGKFSAIPPFLVMVKIMPNGNPINIAKKLENTTIKKVSFVASH